MRNIEVRPGSDYLGTPQEVLYDVLCRPLDYNLPMITSSEPINEGTIHHVFRLTSEDNKRFYLKIRGNRFSGLPQFSCNPSDIFYEYKATLMLHNLTPDNVPSPIFFNSERFFMILTDALPNGKTLEFLLRTGQFRPEILNVLGATLRFIHNKLNGRRESIREEQEDLFFQTKIQQKFGRINHPVLNHLIEELTTHSPRQLIIGDLLPKNIGVNNNGVLITFFDLEDVHRGTIDFELGYLMGHLILHSSTAMEATEYINSLLKGYGERADQNNEILETIVIGSVIHRLNSPAPYNLRFSRQEKESIIRRAERILYEGNLKQLSWSDLIQKIIDN